MKRHLLLAPISAIALCPGLLTMPAIAEAATTATTPSCSSVDMQAGDGTCADQTGGSSSASASTHATATTVNGVNIRSSVRVLAYIQAHGATHAQMQGKHYRLHHGRTMWTSYINTSGNEVWHWKWYAKGHLFVKGRDGYWHDTVCWNKVVGVPNGRRHVGHKVYAKVKIVQRFYFRSTATASVSDYVKVSAGVWVNTYDQSGNLFCHSDASASGSASFAASSVGSASGWVLSRVQDSARSRASGNLSIQLQGRSLVDIHANTWASASGTATAAAAVNVHCSQAPNTPPAQSPLVSVGQKNDVDVNDTATVTADYDLASTDSGSLKFTADYGSFPTGLGGNIFTVTGQGQQPTEYKAPSEVPPGSYDHITVTLRDNSSGLSASASTPIKINPTPPPPL